MPESSDVQLVVVSDLHLNHRKSRPTAEAQAAEVVAAGGEVLLLLGDAAVADGDVLEECLALFDGFSGPKLFVPGNHDLWSNDHAADALMDKLLPERVRAIGWHWLQGEPFRMGDLAVVGNLGWYDLTFRYDPLRIPLRFYEHFVSPGYVLTRGSPKHLIDEARDCPPPGRDLLARWNDGRFVKEADRLFDRCLADLKRDLEAVSEARQVVAATHTVPLPQLMPPRHLPQLDFARAYLGSPALGAVMTSASNVSHILCGHSHWPVEAEVNGIACVNVGSGYRGKHTVRLSLRS